MKGAFVSVEGMDGAGKTTQLDFVEGWLGERGVRVERTREPGGTALGERLRGILLGEGGREEVICDKAELLLFFAARAQHVAEVIAPSLREGVWVLCDRFTDASYAYQGGGRGLAEGDIAALEEFTQGGLQPDLTLLLDVAPEVGRKRVQQRDIPLDEGGQGGGLDRFEQEEIAFNRAVRAVYQERAKRYAERIRVIDANGEVGEVQAQIAEALGEFLKGRGG